MAGMIALGASLVLLGQFGQQALARRILEITDLACRKLTEIGAEIHSDRQRKHASGIVSFTLPSLDPTTIRSKCVERGVVLICRSGRLRISPHAYNNEDDLDRLVAALAAAR